MAWHSNANTRKRGGDQAEKLFAKHVLCHCGSRFKFIGNRRKGFPDFTCENCGQLVDVKSSPQAEQTGNIAISAIPWSHYHDETLIAVFIHGEWIGQYKQFIYVPDPEPRKPTHDGRHSYLKNTDWHLISWKSFPKLSDLGYIVTATQKEQSL